METSPSTGRASAGPVAPSDAPPAPPVAERRTVTTEVHGETRADDYEWLRD